MQYLDQGLEENADRKLIHSQVVDAIYRQIAQLPQQYRLVVQLSFIEGKSIPEVAEQMGLAYKTIQNLKAKAIQRLRLRLFKDELISITILFFFLLQLQK